MFETHKLNEKGFLEVHMLKQRITDAVEDVLQLMPENREKNLFKTNIETAMFYGTKCIAAKPENHTEIVTYSSKGAVTNASK